jgi:hypothetical protein
LAMDNERKYRQRGYMDDDRERGSEGRRLDERPRQPGPRLPLDVTGPRLPRLVQSVAASRCYSCATTLPQGTDFRGECPKCGAALHCCKQCAHFEPSTRFQCRKPIPTRIAVKDQANECESFSQRVTVARDATAGAVAPPMVNTNQEPRGSDEARAAFDSLFKK